MFDEINKLVALDIGISSKRCEFVEEDFPFKDAIQLMQNKRFDLLPIRNKGGRFLDFYVSSEWNRITENSVSIKSFEELPKISANSNFMELLNFFDESSHKFALLESSKEINGLISSVNVSWPPIYFHLYNIIATFEMKLTEWLFSIKKENEVFDYLLNSSNNTNNKHITLGQYLIDQKKGNENHLREYLFLASVLNIIASKGLYKMLSFSSRSEFEECTKYLAVIRNNIAHPVRRMIKNSGDFKRIKQTLKVIERITVQLDNN